MHAARPRLLWALLAAVLLLISAATIGISGVELASGYTFGTVELRLILRMHTISRHIRPRLSRFGLGLAFGFLLLKAGV